MHLGACERSINACLPSNERSMCPLRTGVWRPLPLTTTSKTSKHHRTPSHSNTPPRTGQYTRRSCPYETTYGLAMTLMATTRRTTASRQSFSASWALLSLLVLLLPSFAQTAAAKSSSDSAGSSSTKGAFQKVSRLFVCVYRCMWVRIASASSVAYHSLIAHEPVTVRFMTFLPHSPVPCLLRLALLLGRCCEAQYPIYFALFQS